MPSKERPSNTDRDLVPKIELKTFLRRFFISHTWKDTEITKDVQNWLEKDLHQDTIIDALDFVPGQNIPERMRQAEKLADHTLCVVSEHYFKSKWSTQEFNAAFKADKKGKKPNHLVILLTGNITNEELPDPARESFYIDLRGKTRAQAKEIFIRDMKALLRETRRPRTELEHDNQVLFAKFRKIENTTNQPAQLWPYILRNEMVDTVRSENMQFLEVLNEVETEEQARKLLNASGAKLVIWGAIGKTYVETNYTFASNDHVGFSLQGTKLKNKINEANRIVSLPNFKAHIQSAGNTGNILSILSGELNLSKNNYREATRIFTQLLNRLSINDFKDFAADTYQLRGLAYEMQGLPTKAIEDFTNAILLGRKTKLNYYCRGNAYFHQDQFTLAIADLDKTISLGMENSLIYGMRGISHFEEQSYENAAMDLTKAINLGMNDDPNIYFFRGRAYLETGRLKKAISDYSQAITLGLRNPVLYQDRGFAYFEEGQFIEAISDLNKTIEFAPKDAESYHMRGQSYLYLKKWPEALADFEKYTSLIRRVDPDITETISRLKNNIASNLFKEGVDFQKTNNLNQAIKKYSKAIELWPEFTIAYYSRARAFFDLNQREKAKKDINTALKIPQTPPEILALILDLKSRLE